jgi:hypothetical protein
MELKEFLEKFLPDYEELFHPLFRECIEHKLHEEYGYMQLIKVIQKKMFETYFPVMIEHFSRRQREICAETYYRETEVEQMNWNTYEKIKHAKKPQNYNL